MKNLIKARCLKPFKKMMHRNVEIRQKFEQNFKFQNVINDFVSEGPPQGAMCFC